MSIPRSLEFISLNAPLVNIPFKSIPKVVLLFGQKNIAWNIKKGYVCFIYILDYHQDMPIMHDFLLPTSSQTNAIIGAYTPTDFKKIWIQFCIWAGVIPRNDVLEGADLRGVDLRRVDLRRVELIEVDLEGANLEGANLEGANLKGANLKRANLKRANLREVHFDWADLNGANINGADLRRSYLSRAYIKVANLRRANYKGAILY